MSELFKRSLEKEGLYPEMSSVLRDGEVQNQAWRTERLQKNRYVSDPTINRNSQLSLIKSLPIQSQGNRSHGSNRKDVGRCLRC